MVQLINATSTPFHPSSTVSSKSRMYLFSSSLPRITSKRDH